MSKFKELGLRQDFADALEKVGYTDPTPIQEQAIPELLKGSDVIGQAQTGTGKTAAFGLPMLQSIDRERREVQALVLTPTRELCIQVAQSLRAYGQVAGVDVLATFGGAPIRQQMDRLKNGPQVVVGTVGRVLDLHSRHSLMFHDARFVVLDEADEMLDLGFLEDVELILSKCPRGRQTALFSATMPPAIAKLAEEYLIDPVTIRVKAPTLTIDTVEHFQFATTRKDKVDDVIKILEAERPTQAILFARTKIGVDRLARDLDRRKPGLRVRALHGDMSQGSRDGVMIAFKDNRVPVLVATDIAARGLDVQNVTHVFNYDLPNSAEIYTHRIGRTGRAGRGGRAITLVEPRDKEDFRAIEKHINVDVPQWSAAVAGKPAAGAASGGGRAASASAAAGGGAGGDRSAGDDGGQRSAGGERTRRPRQRAGRPESAGAEPTDATAADEIEAVEVAAEEVAAPEVAAPEVAAEVAAESEVAAPEVEPSEDVVPEPDAPEVGAPLEVPAPPSALDADVQVGEAAAGIIPDRSADEPKPAPFTWGPPASKTEEPEPETGDEPGTEPEATAPEAAEAEATTESEAATESEAPEAQAAESATAQDAEPEAAASEQPRARQRGELRRPRHLKPDQDELDGGFSLVIVSGGTRSGIEPADIIELVTSKSDLTGSQVRRVRVLSRYTLMQVPSDRAGDVAGAIDGSELRGARIGADAVVARGTED